MLLFLESVSRSMRFIIVKFAINIHNLSYNTNQFEKLFQRALQLSNNTRKNEGYLVVSRSMTVLKLVSISY